PRKESRPIDLCCRLQAAVPARHRCGPVESRDTFRKVASQFKVASLDVVGGIHVQASPVPMCPPEQTVSYSQTLVGMKIVTERTGKKQGLEVSGNEFHTHASSQCGVGV